MITIADIARTMQLSTATVSNALTGKGRISEEKRREIVETAQAMGYDFSRIRANRSNHQNICIMVEQVGITFCDRIVQGICSEAEKIGAQTTIINMNILAMTDWSYNPPIELLRSVLQKKCEQIDSNCMGVIYVSQYPRDMTGILPRMPFPIICTYAYTNDGIPCINYDDQQGAYLAVSHLVSRGCKHIAMISGAVDSIPMTKRFAGYQRALVQAGLDFRLEYVSIASWNEVSGYTAMKQLLELPQCPDGVFCQSDYIAIGAMRAVKDAGLQVPKDIAIVGFDDIDAATLVDPQLTTIAPPHTAIGCQAVQKLIQIVKKKDDGNRNIKLQCWLLNRAST